MSGIHIAVKRILLGLQRLEELEEFFQLGVIKAGPSLAHVDQLFFLVVQPRTIDPKYSRLPSGSV